MASGMTPVIALTEPQPDTPASRRRASATAVGAASIVTSDRQRGASRALSTPIELPSSSAHSNGPGPHAASVASYLARSYSLVV
jgi:hypothetical protein